MEQGESSPPPNGTTPPAYLEESLEDAERLPKYAAEIGVEVDIETRSDILHAKTMLSSGWRRSSCPVAGSG